MYIPKILKETCTSAFEYACPLSLLCVALQTNIKMYVRTQKMYERWSSASKYIATFSLLCFARTCSRLHNFYMRLHDSTRMDLIFRFHVCVGYINASHANKWVMSHAEMSHVSCRNESCLRCHSRIANFRLYKRFMHPTRQRTHTCVYTQTRIEHCSLAYTSCTWAKSHIWREKNAPQAVLTSHTPHTHTHIRTHRHRLLLSCIHTHAAHGSSLIYDSKRMKHRLHILVIHHTRIRIYAHTRIKYCPLVYTHMLHTWVNYILVIHRTCIQTYAHARIVSLACAHTLLFCKRWKYI